MGSGSGDAHAGKAADRHPTSFERIGIEFAMSSPDAAPADLQKAVAMAEGTICPVWAMLKGNVEIVPSLRVVVG